MIRKFATAFKMLKNNQKDIPYALFRNFSKLGLTKFLSDKKYIKIAYRLSLKKTINLNSPQTFNEKIQWLKLNDRQSKYTTMVDKYRVRNYIKETLGESYLIPLLGVWDNAKDINFDSLPDKFVLKCNHDSGSVIVCKNKLQLNKKNVIKKLNKSLKKSGYWFGREWPYKNVKPCIIAEKYMIDTHCDDINANSQDFNNSTSKIEELKDYKFFCFSGKVKCFKIDFNRHINHRANYYDRDGNLLKFGEKLCPPDFNLKLSIPENLDKMIEIAELLSQNDIFVRVDLYNIKGKIYFGELTYYPASGFGAFMPEEWDKILGDWINLPI